MTSSIVQSNSKWARDSTDPGMKRFRQKEYNLVTRANPMLSIPEAFLAIEGVEVPKCEICKEPSVFVSLNLGFSRFCSNSCKDAYEVISPEDLRGKKAKNLSQGDLRKLWKVHGLSSSEVYLLCHPGSDACKVCGGHSRFVSMSEGFSGFCGISCSNKVKDFSRTPEKNLEIQKKRRKTTMERYGVENNLELVDLSGDSNPMRDPIVHARQQSTMMERYGAKCISEVRNISVPQNISLYRIYGNRTHFINQDDYNWNFISSNFVNDEVLNIKSFCKYFNCSVNVASRVIDENGLIRPRSGPETLLKEFFNVDSDRSVIGPYEIDLLFHEHNLGVEVNGIYWHSSKFKKPNYHVDKLNLAEKSGIELLQFWDIEIEEKPEIVKSMISSKIGISRKVHGRKCRVQEIDIPTARVFCEENHIQGYSKSNYRIGLFLGDDLVSVMTFGVPRFNHKYQYELIRFCSKSGITVVGGASKLLRYFERTYKPRSILSYANRRWSNGKVYRALGFILTNKTRPNYFHFKGGHYLQRYDTQKHKLPALFEEVDMGMTEKGIMKENGYLCVHDCGNLVYVKTYEKPE